MDFEKRLEELKIKEISLSENTKKVLDTGWPKIPLILLALPVTFAILWKIFEHKEMLEFAKWFNLLYVLTGLLAVGSSYLAIRDYKRNAKAIFHELKKSEKRAFVLSQSFAENLKFNHEWTSKVIHFWPQKASFVETPLREKLEAGLRYLLFKADISPNPAEDVALTAVSVLESVVNFVGPPSNYGVITDGKDIESMAVAKIQTQEIAEYVGAQKNHATDYLCVISANAFTDFLKPNSDTYEITDDEEENFYRQFKYFSEFDKADKPKDRITRVFSIPCDDGGNFPRSNDLTAPQVHRLFCYLWMNWFAGVDTKYHMYVIGKAKNRNFLEIADYVLCHSPSKEDVIDKYCVFVAIPGNENNAYQFIGTPLLHELFMREFYHRLSLSYDDTKPAEQTIDFLFRNRDRILIDFRANEAAGYPDGYSQLSKTLNKILCKHIRNLEQNYKVETTLDRDGMQKRVNRLKESYKRWFPEGLKCP